jgi:hypothetical protein
MDLPSIVKVATRDIENLPSKIASTNRKTGRILGTTPVHGNALFVGALLYFATPAPPARLAPQLSSRACEP